jgi:hypothetical protein
MVYVGLNECPWLSAYLVIHNTFVIESWKESVAAFERLLGLELVMQCLCTTISIKHGFKRVTRNANVSFVGTALIAVRSIDNVV